MPALNYYWLEVLLQGLLYQTPDWYEDPQETKKKIEAELKSRGLIVKTSGFLGQIQGQMTKSSTNLKENWLGLHLS